MMISTYKNETFLGFHPPFLTDFETFWSLDPCRNAGVSSKDIKITMNVNKIISKGKWTKRQKFTSNWDYTFTIDTDKFQIVLTGGSVLIQDKATGETLHQLKGYNYLYTGDVKPDETELFALENGKHFYIFSLTDFTQKLRVTLPRSYESIDVYGTFSEDGESLYVPVHKWDGNGYEYYLCQYETKTYSLVSMEKISHSKVPRWI
jgi:hypothetical protein